MQVRIKGCRFLSYAILHLIILIYSFAGVFSKYAGREPFLSFRFCLFYGLMMFMLVIYALLWQQILKKIPLTTAFCNKAITIVWSIIWGRLFFGENITAFRFLGAAVVMIGVFLVVSDNE